MRPKPFVQMQAFATAAVAIVSLLVLGSGVALGVAVTLSAGTLIWCFFAARYRWLRKRRNCNRSDWRRERDDAMVQCLLGGLVAPAVLAAVGGVILEVQPLDPPLEGPVAVLLALSALLVPLAMLVSSSVDWYLIRPFRDGVLGAPVCQCSVQDSELPQVYATHWVLHRMVSEFLVFAAVLGVIAIVASVAGEATDSNRGETILNVLGVMGALAWIYREQAKLLPALAFVRKPSEAAIGAWITGRSKHGLDVAGFVLDLSVDPGVQVIGKPRGRLAKDIADDRSSVPLEYRDTISEVEPPRPLCPGLRCEFWVAQCDVGLRQFEREVDDDQD